MEITSAHIFEILSLIIITPYNVLAADYSTSTNVVVIRLCCLSPAYLSKLSLICDFCPSDQGFAYSFLQIPPHDGHPCCSAIHFPLPGHVQDFHLRERAHGAQTKRAPPGALYKKRTPGMYQTIFCLIIPEAPWNHGRFRLAYLMW